MDRPSPANAFQSTHARLLLTSFRRFVGRPLIENGLSEDEAARRLFHAPFIVASHNAAADPVLTYGNAAALNLWEVDWHAFTAMPSRLTAEPVQRDERARLLEAAEAKGFIDNYSGVRISATGRRFRIENAIIWTLVDDSGIRIGQAATFASVKHL